MQKLRELPSPYYRVTTRAIILDAQQRMLVLECDNGILEFPGGGWEYDESFEDCLRREVREELGVAAAQVGEPWFCYRGRREGYVWHVRICARVELASYNFRLEPQKRAARFVTRAELLALPLPPDEAPIKDFADKIWPQSVPLA